MGQIKKWYRSIPIWLTLFLFMIIALMVAFLISSKVMTTVNELTMGIQIKYITTSNDQTPENNTVMYQGDEIERTASVNFNYEKYSNEDWMLFQAYRIILNCAPSLIYSLCILIAVLLFYFSKIKIPLRLINHASEYITAQNLDFTIDYSGNDEMAKLCTAFSTMRSALDENNQKMLHMIDERKQLNDAYTHDLRTPITVLKGYTDMLVKYLPEGKLSTDEVLDTVKTMSSHVSRLEQFVSSMNTIQKLEDMTICKEAVASVEFLEQLRDTAVFLCEEKGLSCTFEAPVFSQFLTLDPTVVTQVYENMLSNAIRFAKQNISVYCTYETRQFSISVSDDGKGFSDKELIMATHPYYSGQGEKQSYHFGLGLHICRMLCEKHGGRLLLENGTAGGAKVTATFKAI